MNTSTFSIPQQQGKTRTMFPAKRIMLIFMLLFTGFSLHCFGDSVISESGIYPLGDTLEYYVDESNNLLIEDICSPEIQSKFKKSNEETPNFSYTASAIWTQFTLQGLASSSWYLELDAYKEVQIFLPDESGNYSSLTGGRGFQNPAIIKKLGDLLVPLRGLPDTSTIYIRYVHDDTMILHVTLWKEAAYITQKREDLFYGIYCGVILVMIVYNILLFFILRDTSYIYYAVYVFSMLVVQLVFSGILTDFLPPEAHLPTDIIETCFLGLSVAAFLFFMKRFLFTNLLHRNINFIANTLATLALLHIPLAFIAPYLIRTVSISIVFAIVLPLNLSVIFITLKKKYIPAIFYAIAQFSLLAGTSFFILRNFGFIPSIAIAEFGMPMGSMIEAILLSLGLAHRVHILQRQKQMAQEWSIQNKKMAEKFKKDYQKLFELNPIGIALFDKEGKYLEVNSSYCRIYHGARNDFIGRNYYDVVFPEHLREKEKLRFEHLVGNPGKKVVSFEQSNITKHGKRIAAKYFIDYTRDRDGSITGILACCQNTTKLRKVLHRLKSSINEKDILLKEVHHRVKNNLQIMVSLFRIQSRNFTDPAIIAIFESTAGRIRTIANIHNRLYQAKNMARIDFTEFIQSIVAQTLSLSGPSGSQIETTFEISSDSLPVDIAIPLGLIINELVSNTVKHAFQSIPEPQLFISLQKNFLQEKKLKDTYILIVRDNGIGLPEDFDINTAESFGMTLVENLVDQLDGTLILNNEKGAAFTISFEYGRPENQKPAK
ncbi:MAG: PAS domain S-box protein [Spirochaetales bacterium]|nr:PAS domain S-box protein [Spirochaetales bacterium]